MKKEEQKLKERISMVESKVNREFKDLKETMNIIETDIKRVNQELKESVEALESSRTKLLLLRMMLLVVYQS